MTDPSGPGAANPAPELDPAPPDPGAWAAIPDDDFGAVVAHARRALHDLEDHQVSAAVRRLRAIPSSRLVRGGGRRRLLAALADGGPLWVATRARIDRDPDLVARIVAALEPGPAPAAAGDDRADDVIRDRLAELGRTGDELRAQRDRARAERDEARRQRVGAQGREASLRADLAAARAELSDLHARLDQQAHQLAGAEDQRRAAVARESRRGDGRRRELEVDLAEARRELDDLRRDRARRPAVSTPSSVGTPPAGVDRTRSRPASASASAPEVDRVRPGRPSRLPRGLRIDAREGATALVDAVGRLLVDGYNVTRTHRANLELEAQRDWLVRGLGALAARRKVDIEVVFDAHLDPGGSGSGRRRDGVRVSYTLPGITADDEIVLAVEATDVGRPLVVVTDDRELRERLRPARVDLLPTASLVWLLG